MKRYFKFGFASILVSLLSSQLCFGALSSNLKECQIFGKHSSTSKQLVQMHVVKHEFFKFAQSSSKPKGCNQTADEGLEIQFENKDRVFFSEDSFTGRMELTLATPIEQAAAKILIEKSLALTELAKCQLKEMPIEAALETKTGQVMAYWCKGVLTVSFKTNDAGQVFEIANWSAN